jgi:predicted O-linked N-acetylglucosamine transferase (SPINDLY family)
MGIPEKGIVFCCLNNSYKITPVIFAVWMRLLKATAGSVLFLLGENEVARENLRKAAVGYGVESERLIFSQRKSYTEYLASYRVADLFLDTFPFNAGTTASDALWAGLPLLTCSGRAFASRMAGSLLNAIGLPELITNTLEQYEAKALELIRDPNALFELRKKLEANRSTSLLFDTAKFTRNLEFAYLQMHDRALGGDHDVFPREIIC